MPTLAQITNPAINPKLGTGNGVTGFQLVAGNLIQMAFIAGSVIAFVVLLIGSIEYITGGGDKEATQKAGKKITSSLIGLALLFSVFAIISIIERLFGLSITKLNLPSINQP